MMGPMKIWPGRLAQRVAFIHMDGARSAWFSVCCSIKLWLVACVAQFATGVSSSLLEQPFTHLFEDIRRKASVGVWDVVILVNQCVAFFLLSAMPMLDLLFERKQHRTAQA